DSTARKHSPSLVSILKQKRNAEELARLSNYKFFHSEETYLQRFEVMFEQFKNNLNQISIPIEVRNIFLQSCLDKWAFWLDENTEEIKKEREREATFNAAFSQFNIFESDEHFLIDSCETWFPWI